MKQRICQFTLFATRALPPISCTHNSINVCSIDTVLCASVQSNVSEPFCTASPFIRSRAFLANSSQFLQWRSDRCVAPLCSATIVESA